MASSVPPGPVKAAFYAFVLSTWSTVFIVVSGLAFGFCSFMARDPDGNVDNSWLAGFVIFGALALGLPAAENYIAKSEIKRHKEEVERIRETVFAERVEEVVTLNDVLDPLIARVADAAVERSRIRRAELANSVVGAIVTAAANYIGPPRARACLYKMIEGPPQRVEPTPIRAGRSGSARSTFVEGTPGGDAVIKLIGDRQPYRCTDVDTNPPPGWNNRVRDYKSFISAPITAGQTAFGMLTLDCPEPDLLTKADEQMLMVFAHMIATAYAIL